MVFEREILQLLREELSILFGRDLGMKLWNSDRRTRDGLML